MSSVNVAIVDYGLGNIYSIRRAVEFLGASCKVSDDPEVLAAEEKVILPGVGAFGEGMANLNRNGLSDAIRRMASDGRQILGICLGMQLFMDYSEELGNHRGLGIIKGGVKRLDMSGKDVSFKIPHVGWNAIRPVNEGHGWDGTVLRGLQDGSFMYFVHSFVAAPEDSRDIAAMTSYGGCDFPSVVRKGSVSGCQFHPENSGPAGLAILKNFLYS